MKIPEMIKIDFDEEFLYSTAEIKGADGIEPEEFTTVCISLKSTPELLACAAEKTGCKESDMNGFNIDIDKYMTDTVDYRITFYVNRKPHYIVLTTKELYELRDCIDKQLKEKLGYGISELIED